MERALCHGGGWLVSMQHFCLHDCATFAIWHVLVIGSVIVALCTFCDALTSPVLRRAHIARGHNCGDAHLCGLELSVEIDSYSSHKRVLLSDVRIKILH